MLDSTAAEWSTSRFYWYQIFSASISILSYHLALFFSFLLFSLLQKGIHCILLIDTFVLDRAHFLPWHTISRCDNILPHAFFFSSHRIPRDFIIRITLQFTIRLRAVSVVATHTSWLFDSISQSLVHRLCTRGQLTCVSLTCLSWSSF